LYVNFGDPDWSTVVAITVPEASPTISAIANLRGTAEGATLGGTTVTISGTGYGENTQVTFGGTGAEILERSPTRLTVSTPPNEAGPVDVAVTADGMTATDVGGFRYLPPPTLTGIEPGIVSTEGGEAVVGGEGFTPDLELSVNGELVIGRTVTSAGTIVVSVPPGVEGAATLVVRTAYGVAESSALLRYADPPGKF
jgi:hypothetical protein